MKPEQLIDQLADAIGVPRTATSMTIYRQWGAQRTLKVTIEYTPTPANAEHINQDVAANILRAAQDFEVTNTGELREVPGIRDAVEITTGS